MDCGLKTLLLDSFRKPDVPREVRLDAALGQVAPRGQEQLALLVLLVDDPDAEVRAAAEQTLTAIAPARLAAVLARSDTLPNSCAISPAAASRRCRARDLGRRRRTAAAAGARRWDTIAGSRGRPSSAIDHAADSADERGRCVRAAMKGCASAGAAHPRSQ
jgi:hypothetical protein